MKLISWDNNLALIKPIFKKCFIYVAIVEWHTMYIAILAKKNQLIYRKPYYLSVISKAAKKSEDHGIICLQFL